MDQKVLIISSEDDPHVKAVGEHLSNWGYDYCIKDFADLIDMSVTVDLQSDTLSVGATELSDCTSIWLRRLFPLRNDLLSKPHLDFAQNEFRHATVGRLLAMDVRWVSHPEALRLASFKARQYWMAKYTYNLKIPDTLITSDASRAKEFIETNRPSGTIIKCLGAPVIEYDGETGCFFTNEVNDEVISVLDDLKYAPCILQPLIKKIYEVRANVVGDQMFAAKIDTKGNEKARVDWRFANVSDLPHEPITVPEGIKKSCISMCKDFGLKFGAFDFLVDNQGVWYFLEVNPNGQWYWIEEMTDLKISEALARELVRN